MELEQGKNVDFWRDMTTITEDEISKLRKLEASGKGPGRFPDSRTILVDRSRVLMALMLR